MEQLLQFLLEEHKAKAQDLVQEGKLISSASIICA